MTAIHQMVAGFSKGDAISNEAIVLRNLFRSWGRESRIFTEPRHTHPDLRAESEDARTAASVCGKNDVVLLHLSIGSDVNDLFRALPCRKAILYHNITPSSYFEGMMDDVAAPLRRGREQAAALKDTADVVMAVSEFNARELREMGYRNVRVFPLMLDLSQLRGAADPVWMDQYDDGLVNVLFVGRCVPNKRIEDVLQAFYFFQTYVQPNSRFIHAGSFVGLEKYHALLLAMSSNLGLWNVHYPGAIAQDQLNALYRRAHVFLCMSEHEGFCIPLIESMIHRVPVLAYAAGAVPETLDGAGVLFREKRFDAVAEMMGRLTKDASFRAGVLRGQDERLARFTSRNLEQELKQHLATLL